MSPSASRTRTIFALEKKLTTRTKSWFYPSQVFPYRSESLTIIVFSKDKLEGPGKKILRTSLTNILFTVKHNDFIQEQWKGHAMIVGKKKLIQNTFNEARHKFLLGLVYR